MTEARAPQRREVLWFALAALLWLAATAWARPLMLPDEGRYAGVAWEMLRSGDWLTPTLDGLPYFHKPPLFYWITAGSMSMFGLNEWAARAAPLAGGWTAVFSMILFTRHWQGWRTGRLVALALLAQPLILVGAQFANLDMLVAGCITASIVLSAHAALCLERGLPGRCALAGAYAMAALGVLAKGLIGAVLPALVIAAWLLTRGRWRLLVALLWWPGAALFALLAAPWFVAMQMRFTGFFDYFFVVQHFKRFAAGDFNNAQPFWFFPALLGLFCLPWLPWLLRALRQVRSADEDVAPIRLLMVLWAGLVVLFFSLPQSKLVGYILPAMPPLAWLAVDGYASHGLASARSRRLWLAGLAVGALVGVGAVVALAVRPLPSSRALALQLVERRAAQEPVFMLGHYHFDLPFYARLPGPVGVVDDWAAGDADTRDNWRKELADAGRFDRARAANVLVERASLPARLCLVPVSWVVGSRSEAGAYPLLAHARVVVDEPAMTLWRVERANPAIASSLRCAGTPNGDPEGR